MYSQDVASSQGCARETEISAELAVQPGHVVAGADVWHIANVGLRHGEHRILSRHPEGRRCGKTDASSHCANDIRKRVMGSYQDALVMPSITTT